MTGVPVAHLALGLLPVLCFLLALISLDSFKLVRLRMVLALLAAGSVAAGAALIVNPWLAEALGLGARSQTRYVAPLVEELLKGLIVAWLIARRRVAFMVDAAICGFAVGAGFAAAENLSYFAILENPPIGVWLVRGFGTAVLHGGVTAVMAIVTVADQRGATHPASYVYGWLLAAGIHSGFNHFFLRPHFSALLVLSILPALFFILFRIGERRTRRWLGTGFDTDAELLQLIGSGRLSETAIGKYLNSLRTKFPPATVADMLCLLRLRLELSIRAKGILLLQQAGLTPEPDPEVKEKFAELRYLERAIGKTGMTTLNPILNFSDQDLWQYHMLSGAQRVRASRAGQEASR
jgi:RsiW-degrading membrane proteinase PrsW (M82 family)